MTVPQHHLRRRAMYSADNSACLKRASPRQSGLVCSIYMPQFILQVRSSNSQTMMVLHHHHRSIEHILAKRVRLGLPPDGIWATKYKQVQIIKNSTSKSTAFNLFISISYQCRYYFAKVNIDLSSQFIINLSISRNAIHRFYRKPISGSGTLGYWLHSLHNRRRSLYSPSLLCSPARRNFRLSRNFVLQSMGIIRIPRSNGRCENYRLFSGRTGMYLFI